MIGLTTTMKTFSVLDALLHDNMRCSPALR